MAVLDLIQQARDAGLSVAVDGTELVVRGPRKLASIAKRLMGHKAEVLTALRPTAEGPIIDTTDAKAILQAALDELEGEFPRDVLAALRTADVRWASDQPTEVPPLGEPADLDDERAAIQWADTGPRADVDAAYQAAAAEWNEIAGSLARPSFPSVQSAPAVVPPGNVPQTNVPTVQPLLPPAKVAHGNRLIGIGFAPIPPTIPPPEILATPRTICPSCGVRPVLPELREMTGGQCWDCWFASESAKRGRG